MSRHTPGLLNPCGCVHKDEPAELYQTTMRNWKVVCICGRSTPYYETDTEAIADWNRQTAAPDLLEYAKAQERKDGGFNNPWRHNCYWCGECNGKLGLLRRAAIAKAEPKG